MKVKMSSSSSLCGAVTVSRASAVVGWERWPLAELWLMTRIVGGVEELAQRLVERLWRTKQGRGGQVARSEGLGLAPWGSDCSTHSSLEKAGLSGVRIVKSHREILLCLEAF